MNAALLIASIFQALNGLVLIWCLLSWFPAIRWYEPPFKWLDQVVRPIVAPFQKLIPPIANIDVSPIVAMLVLQAVGNILIHLVS